MTRLSEAAKQIIIKKILSNNGQTIAEVAQANNVGKSTLSKWVRDVRSGKKIITTRQAMRAGVQITAAERFKHLQETFGKGDVMVGAYCRKHGLYPHQLTQWEADFMTKASDQKYTSQANVELKELRAEIKMLKETILRKDKVLAEAVALLVLKKRQRKFGG